MTHYIATIPVTYGKDQDQRTRFTRVGALFQNTRRDTGEVFFSLKLDFPVGATELVFFPPRSPEVTEDDAPAD